MLSMIQYFYNYLKQPTDKKLIKQKLVDELAKLESYSKDEVNESEISEIKLQKQTNYFKNMGIITSLESTHGIIDKTLYFELHQAKDVIQRLNVGCKVSYLAYKVCDDIPIKVIKINEVIKEIWENEFLSYDNSEIKEEYCQDNAEYFDVHRRSVSGLVTNVRDGMLTINTDLGDISKHLREIRIQFSPIVGDWLYLMCQVKSDTSFVDFAGEIVNVDVTINPTRSQTTTGTVTSISDGFGVINKQFSFYQDALEDNYKPQIGDEVSFDAIESDQKQYTWRCLKIVLIGRSNNINMTDNKENYHSDLIQNKNGIVITDSIVFSFEKLKETGKLSMIVTNEGDKNHTILRSYFMIKKRFSQIRLISPSTDESFNLKPGSSVTYVFEATARFDGINNEMFVIKFKDSFKIGRNITIRVGNNEIVDNNLPLHNNIHYTQKSKEYARTIWNQKVDVIKGVSMFRRANFIAVEIGLYSVPPQLKNIVLRQASSTEIDNDLLKYLPFLNTNLNPSNYVKIFHSLLYLEEIKYFENMRIYDRETCHFKKEKEYLSLEIEGIAETRPSLIIGDTVRVTNPWELGHNKKPYYEGFIHKVLSNRILLKFNENFHNCYNGENYKIEFFFGRGNLRKQHHAVDKILPAMGLEVIFPLQITPKKRQLDVDVINGDLILNQVGIGKEVKWFNQNLNDKQKEAVKNILRGEARPMPYVIFGPPGTGKTITVVEIILQIVTFLPNSRLIIATPSNSAANLITEQIISSNVLYPGDFVRIVGEHVVEKELIPEHLLPYCATCNIDQSNQKNHITTESGLKMKCSAIQLGRHRISIGTCNTIGNYMMMGFPKNHFTHVLIDEAGQCLETEIIIPMTLVDEKNGQIILAGDPKQLGPIVLSNLAAKYGLGISFLDRILQRFPYKKFNNGFDERLVTKLIYNYRSIPSILKLYSIMFYDDQLQSMITEEDVEMRLLNKLMDIWPDKNRCTKNHAVFFYGIQGENRQNSNNPSWYNTMEANKIFHFILSLYKKGIKMSDIGVITPYQQQVKVIRSILREADIELPKIGTVEEFQGQERNIILISTVRSTPSLISLDLKHSLGFVQNEKRLNVAISRAKVLLVIFGNQNLLAQDKNWREVISYCVKHGAYFGSALPPSFDPNLLDMNSLLDRKEMN